jgi:hypothetical protein
MTHPMDETDALMTLHDARASQGWPGEWDGERHENGWAFTSPAMPGKTFVVTDAGSVDRVGESEDAALALERLTH